MEKILAADHTNNSSLLELTKFGGKIWWIKLLCIASLLHTIILSQHKSTIIQHKTLVDLADN